MANSYFLGKVSRWVEKIWNVKGGSAIVDVDPSVRVVLPVPTFNDNLVPNSWQHYGLSVSQAAVAAQVSAIMLRNPPGSGVIAVVDKITVWGAALDQVGLVMFNNPDFATLLTMTASRLDNRLPLSPTLIGSKGSNASRLGVTTACTVQITANGSSVDYILDQNQEVVIAPGDALTIWSSVLNQALNASFFWKERAMEQSELN